MNQIKFFKNHSNKSRENNYFVRETVIIFSENNYFVCVKQLLFFQKTIIKVKGNFKKLLQ